MGYIGFLLLIVGGVLAWFGYQEGRLSSVADEVPKEVTLKELITNGPGDNAHVKLKNFLFCDNYIYESKSKTPNSWTKAWVPIIPFEDAVQKLDKKKPLKLDKKEDLQKLFNTKPSSFQAILKCTKVKNENDLANLEQRGELQGMVINEIESLGSKEREHLKQSYPNTDFEKCLIIEPGREPAGTGKIAGFLGGAAVLGLVGLVLVLIAWRKKAW